MTAKHVTRSITLSDVARQAGVSRTTAAKVLLGTGGEHVRVSEKTRELVQKIADEVNYRPNRAAQQLRCAKSGLIGVLLDTVNTPVMFDRLSAIEDEAACHGYRLLIAQIRHSSNALAKHLAEMASYGVEGLVCLFDVNRKVRPQLAPLFENWTNVVFHGAPIQPAGHCIRVDTVGAIRQSVAHLLDQGRLRIGMELWNMDDELMDLRAEGYQSEFVARTLQVDDSLVWAAHSRSARPTDETIRRAVRYFMGEVQADAIIASNDIWAVRFIQRLKAEGLRIPEDMAVIGYDNLELGTVIEPNLTTVDQCHEMYAEKLLQLMLRLIAGEQTAPSNRVCTVVPRLIVRASG